jgi:transcriptional regulator with XRE-family HTH domain
MNATTIIIKRRLLDLNMSQQALAAATGIHYTTLSQIINQKLTPNADQVSAICRELSQTAADLGLETRG